jgi:lipopolysaccharide/colanic/teichoic acid biosynthesis glycosyltransferase
VGRLLHGYDRVVLNSSPQRRLQWVKYLKGIGIDVEVLTPELEQLGALSMRRSPNGAAVLVAAGPMGLRDRFLKRTLDLFVGFGLLLFFAPLMLAVALAIKLTSPGPVLFKQSRIGRSNRPFDLFKFRSMRTEVCDPAGVVSALRQDARLTPIGAFLRRTSIDELPQLFNVLRGDMSIVGPRPHAPGSTAENDLFWEIDERYWHRGAVKPGITGLAQVRGFRGATSTRKELTDRVQADLEYLADWSLSKDLLIICRTARVIVHPNAF